MWRLFLKEGKMCFSSSKIKWRPECLEVGIFNWYKNNVVSFTSGKEIEGLRCLGNH